MSIGFIGASLGSDAKLEFCGLEGDIRTHIPYQLDLQMDINIVLKVINIV